MEHFTSLCGVLFDFLGNDTLPNSAELMGMYGRVKKSILLFSKLSIFFETDVH